MRRLLLVCLAGLQPAWAFAPASGPAAALEPVADPRGAFSRDRNFDMEKLALDLSIDPMAHTVSGTATWTVRRLAAGDLRLDAVALTVDEVLAATGLDALGAATWSSGVNELTVRVPESDVGAVSVVVVRYHAQPQLGLHWRGPAELGGGQDSPDTYGEVYSQGEGEDNRYWFPSYDHFDDRFAYSGTFHLPPALSSWTVVTNSGPDMPSYLVMLAAGPYDLVPGLAGGVQTRAFVPPGTPVSWVRPVLDPLPDMMSWFAERTGVAYPWGTYTQTFVQRFIYTGMENTSSTIEHMRMLSPPSVQATRSFVPSVVAHELAHQWYGDLLTARTPREMWLNEGFATFFAADWQVHDLRLKEGDAAADQLAAAQIDGWRRGSLDNGSLAGRWALRGGGAPGSAGAGSGAAVGAANHNVYSKGAMVLVMLRTYLGEQAFWDGIRDYTRGHAHSSVDTIDLQRAMEVRSGRDLGWFFQQWTELPGVPKVTTSWSWTPGSTDPTSAERASGVLAVELRQSGGKAGGGGGAAGPVALPVEVSVDGGPAVRAWLTGESLTLTLPAAVAPKFVAIDPRGGLLVDWDQQQSGDAWTAQLVGPSTPYAQLIAVHALAGMPARQPDVLATRLADASAPELLREAVADAIGLRRACDPLLGLLSDADERLRAAGANALGRCADRALVGPMGVALARETNSDVRAALLRSAAAIDPPATLAAARRALSRKDALEPERAAATTALALAGSPSDVAALLRTPAGRDVRLGGLRAAVDILQRQALGPARESLRVTLARSAERLLADLDLRGIQGGIGVLGELGDAQSAAVLEGFARATTLPDLAVRARAAVAAIHARTDTVAPATPNEVGARLQAIEDRVKAVEEREGQDRR